MSSKLLTNIFCTIIFLRLALFTLHTIPIWFPNSVFRTDCLCCNFEGGEFGSICSNSVVNIWYNVDLTNDISLCTSGFDCSCKKIPPPTQQTNNYTLPFQSLGSVRCLFFWKRIILLFSKDAVSWAKLTVKTNIVTEISISN